MKYFHRPSITKSNIYDLGVEITGWCDKELTNLLDIDGFPNFSTVQSRTNFNYNVNKLPASSILFSEKLYTILNDSFNILCPETVRTSTIKPFRIKYRSDTYLVKTATDRYRALIIDGDNSEFTAKVYKTLKCKLTRLYRRDNRYDKTNKYDNQLLDANAIFSINKRLNPKNKATAKAEIKHNIDDLQKYFISLQEKGLDALKLVSNPRQLNHIKLNNNDKFQFELYPPKWEGKEKFNGIKQCLAAGKLKTRGYKMSINKEIISNLPKSFGNHIVNSIRINTLRGCYSNRFLCNKITPIPKKGDPSNIKNIRFLSVPNIFASLEGKYVASALANFIENKNLLYKDQFGFRKYHSCSQAIGTILWYHHVKYHNRKNLLVCLDLSNAFGRIAYAIILHVLSLLVHPVSMVYFNSMFRDRYGVIVSQGQKSEKFRLPKIGCPQGEPTSPIFFNLIIDSVKTVFKNEINSEIVLFADDMSLLISGATWEESFDKATDLVNKVNQFLKKIGLQCSPGKSAGVILGKKDDEPNFKDVLDTNEGPIKIVDETILLGYRFCSNLDNESHVNYICQRFNHQQACLRNLIDYDDKKQLLKIANSLHFGLINYMLDILPKFKKEHYEKLQVILNRTIRMIVGVKISDRISQSRLLAAAEWLCIHYLHQKALLCHINRIIMNKKPFVLYEAIRKCIRYTSGHSFQARDELKYATYCPGGKEYNDFLIKGERIPEMNFDNEFNVPEAKLKKVFPYNVVNFFNQLPVYIRLLLGSPDFTTEVRMFFAIKCQHKLGNKKCSYCSNFENPENEAKLATMLQNTLNYDNIMDILEHDYQVATTKDFYKFDTINTGIDVIEIDGKVLIRDIIESNYRNINEDMTQDGQINFAYNTLFNSNRSHYTQKITN